MDHTGTRAMFSIAIESHEQEMSLCRAAVMCLYTRTRRRNLGIELNTLEADEPEEFSCFGRQQMP